jgi:hypothetical protein
MTIYTVWCLRTRRLLGTFTDLNAARALAMADYGNRTITDTE